jgi:hypothetical protein
VGALVLVTTSARNIGDAAPAPTKKRDLALARTLSNYLSAPDAFASFVSPLTRMTGAAVTVNVASTGCASQYAKVTITPFRESWKVRHKKDFRDAAKSAPNGYILAQIDVDDCDFTRIGLRAGRRAYWVVNLDADLLFTSHFIDVGLRNPPAGTQPQATDLTAGQRWSYGECPQEHTFGAEAAAVQSRANVCYAHDSDATLLAQASTMGSPIRGTLHRKTIRGASGKTVHLVTDVDVPLKDQFLWIVCADGCCYADLM